MIDSPEHDDDQEGAMAKADLYKLAKYSYKLFNKIEDDDQLESWVQAKIIKAADYIASVYHYLEYEMKFSEYGSKLENSDVYSESKELELHRKLTEARQLFSELKKSKGEQLTPEGFGSTVANAYSNFKRGMANKYVQGERDRGRFTSATGLDRAANTTGKAVKKYGPEAGAIAGTAGVATLGLQQMGNDQQSAPQAAPVATPAPAPAATPTPAPAPAAKKPVAKKPVAPAAPNSPKKQSTTKLINKISAAPPHPQTIDPEVQRVQQELVAQGYNLKVDGILGKKTQAAFQNYLRQPTQFESYTDKPKSKAKTPKEPHKLKPFPKEKSQHKVAPKAKAKTSKPHKLKPLPKSASPTLTIDSKMQAESKSKKRDSKLDEKAKPFAGISKEQKFGMGSKKKSLWKNKLNAARIHNEDVIAAAALSESISFTALPAKILVEDTMINTMKILSGLA